MLPLSGILGIVSATMMAHPSCHQDWITIRQYLAPSSLNKFFEQTVRRDAVWRMAAKDLGSSIDP
ncbi:MAG: hypothetical protein HRT91_02965 [Piscirickettsiaceae bacterium]|nr:hypothetical protein [Piscirickettsiaceae bacterium]